MEITLQHTDAIYKNYIIGVIVILILASTPAIAKLIKCRYEFAEYKLKDKLLWIVPVVFFLIDFFVSGLYVIDYAFDRTDVQTVLVEEVDGYNAGCYLISGRIRFHVSSQSYTEGDVLGLMKEEFLGHTCEIESYKTWNDVIRIKVLD
ncbi:MAG: hypothetical protein JXN65_02510 [Clostridia bacterium]|nr:hypothetical protein [Clostridia bacterium]